MKDEDKKFLIKAVGLECYEYTDFRKGKVITPDPLDPADMYGKIWPAFKKDSDRYYEFLDWLGIVTKGTLSQASLVSLVTSPADLIPAMLEYFKEKE